MLVGCFGDAADEGKDNASRVQASEEESGSNNDSVVHLTRLQLETAGIETTSLQQLPLRDVIKVNGYLSVPPDNRAEVSPIMGGIVRQINVREGDRVEAGDVLAELVDPAFFQMQADYRKTSSRIDFLEEEYRRREQLWNDGVGSHRDYQQMRVEYESAVAEMQSFQARLRLLGLDARRILQGEMYETIPVSAPIDGFVEHVSVVSGRYTDATSTLFEILDNSHIHAELMVYERDVHKVDPGQEVLFRYTHQNGHELYVGRIFSIGKVFEENPRGVHVHAEIDQPSDDLLPGMYIDGRIVTDSDRRPALPDDAVLRNENGHLVFIELPPQGDETGEMSVFRAISVRQGISDHGYTEVHFFEPLPETARFVTNGAFYLLTEMNKEGG